MLILYIILEKLDFVNNLWVICIFSNLLICISTDLGGYIFGKIFKGPKLTKVSPNKTYAGVFGGYFLSMVFLSLC